MCSGEHAPRRTRRQKGLIRQPAKPAVWDQGQRIQRAAFHLLRKELEAAVEGMRAEVEKLRLRALREPFFNLFTAIEGLPWRERFEDPVLRGWTAATDQVLRGSTAAALEDLGLPRPRAKQVDAGELQAFERELALSWLEQNGLLRISSITETTKQAVFEALQTGIADNLGVNDILVRIRETIGLTPAMSRQLQGQLDKAVERGLRGRALDRFAAAQRGRMITRRAKAILRTETSAARNAGTLHGWQIAIENEELDPTVWKTWIVKGPCPICAEIAAQGPVPLNRPFFSPLQGQFFTAPPAHINCRCSIGLVNPPAA